MRKWNKEDGWNGERWSPNWERHFDNSDWTFPHASWTGSAWLSEFTGEGTYWVQLTVAGVWAANYRPSKVRLTYTDDSWTEMRIYIEQTDQTPKILDTGIGWNNLVSLQEFDLDFSEGDDMLQLFLVFNQPDAPQFTLTNIEFLN